MRYSKGGEQDLENETGWLKEEYKQYFFTYSISNCADFINQTTDTEQLCNGLSWSFVNNCSIIYTPKFYCEIPGEGIEYSCGAVKKTYRRYPLYLKKRTVNFNFIVRSCITSTNSTMVCRFSCKARRYILGYYHRRLQLNDDSADNLHWNLVRNEKFHKLYKSHSDTYCFDSKFIETVMRESIGVPSCPVHIWKFIRICKTVGDAIVCRIFW